MVKLMLVMKCILYLLNELGLDTFLIFAIVFQSIHKMLAALDLRLVHFSLVCGVLYQPFHIRQQEIQSLQC